MNNHPPAQVLLSRLRHELVNAQIHDEGTEPSVGLALTRALTLVDQLKEVVQ